MKKENFKKVISFFLVVTLFVVHSTNYAIASTVIGEINITDVSWNVIPSSADINWNWNFGGTNNWSGSISGIKVIASVDPIIDMRLSKSLIDLWNIAWITGSGTLDLEVWTNSPSGVTIKVKSQNGGLLHDSGTWTINQTNWGQYSFAWSNWWGAPLSATFPNSAWVEIITADQEIDLYHNNTVENLKALPDTDDLEFKVTALAQSSAKAWDYEDILTFSVISNF